jgi:hypothetical protein
MSAPALTESRPTLLDLAAYWLTVGGVYLLAGFLFFYSGKGKLVDDHGHAPTAIKQQFDETFLGSFPGTDFLWSTIGVLEFAIFAVMVVSLVRGEFLPSRPKALLLVALSLALFTFACLSFGETTTGQLSGTASLYSYFGSTAIVVLLVVLLPPRSPGNWVTGRLAVRASSG